MWGVLERLGGLIGLFFKLIASGYVLGLAFISGTMFILKRQDVEIGSFQHPSKEQKIPILSYQGQTFRLLSVFNAAQEDEARVLWRDLTDNRGKACVLLEEPERFSVWGKIQIDQPSGEKVGSKPANTAGLNPVYVKAGLIIIQALHDDIEDLMGDKQAQRFKEDLAAVGEQNRLPKMVNLDEINRLLKLNPFSGELPPWQTDHINAIFRELHRIGKTYFGRSNFTVRAMEALDELTPTEHDAFLNWFRQLSSGQLWNG